MTEITVALRDYANPSKITKFKPIAIMLQLHKNIDILKALTVFLFNDVIILHSVAVWYQ